MPFIPVNNPGFAILNVMKIIVVLLISLSTTLSIVKAEEVWKITSLNWEPYSGSRMIKQGNSIQKLRKLLKKNDITLQVEFYPWLRAQKVAKTKGYLGYFPAWPEEVKDGFIPSEEVDISNVSIMSRNINNHKYLSIKHLCENFKIGFVRTYVYPHSITNIMSEKPDCFIETPLEATLFLMLSKGRFDFAITDSIVMNHLASQEGIENIHHYKTLMNKKLVIALRDAPDNRIKIKRLANLLKNN
jgi:polar amino acid transport system substrate-binding protein